jgi:DNA (cytosine-5)-methyltransferase 1
MPHAIDLFSGIGGMALAVHAVADGLRFLVACDAEPDCRAVMRLRFGLQDHQLHSDVQTLRAGREGGALGRAAIVYGGFPCQDVSIAGRGLGVERGTRSSLFVEMVRIAAEARSPYLLMENVSSLACNGLAHVLRVMRDAGWTEVRAATLAVSEIGGRHRRRRIFILGRNPALAEEQAREAAQETIRYKPRVDLSAWLQRTWSPQTEPAPRLTEGMPIRGPWAARVRMLGNTCVPQQGEVALRFLLTGEVGGISEEAEAARGGMTWDELWHASADRFAHITGAADEVPRIPPALTPRPRTQLCPTLVANDRQGGSQAARRPDGSYSSMTLARWVRHKPAADTWGMGGDLVPIRRRTIMNVRWAAWLMGFPPDWLDLELPTSTT